MLILDFCSKDSFKALTYEFLDLEQKRTIFFLQSCIFYSTQMILGTSKRPFIQLWNKMLQACMLPLASESKKKKTHTSNTNKIFPALILLTLLINLLCTARRSHPVAKEALQ